MASLRTLLTILTLALFVCAMAYPSVAAREHKDTSAAQPTKTRDKTPDTNSTEADNSTRGSGKDKERGPPSNESAKPREPGKIVQSDLASFDGRYVDFTFDADACLLSDYRVYNVTVLDEIQLPAPCDGRGHGGRGGDHGAAFEVGDGNGSLRIHDAPNGLIQVRADNDTPIRITPSADATFNASDPGHAFTLGNLSGILRVDRNATFDNITGKARFWVHPLSGGSPERVEIRQAIKERRVAAEVDVLVENGTITSEVLAYEEVVLRAQRGANQSFRFIVDANLTSGRTFVVNLGPGVFEQGKVGLRYWDVDEAGIASEVPITEADSLEDALNITEGEGPEYWITQDKAGKHVLVAVPHFSVHVFEVASIPPEVVPVVIWGLIAGVAFVGLGAAGMFRRRAA